MGLLWGWGEISPTGKARGSSRVPGRGEVRNFSWANKRERRGAREKGEGGDRKKKKKHELGEEEERKQQPRRDKKSPKAASRFEEWGVFYGGIVKCALSFPFAGGNEGPHSI